MSAIFDFLNRATRVLLEVDPDSKEKLAKLDGKILCIEVTAPAVTLFVVPTRCGLEIKNHWDAEPDVTLRGSAAAFARLGAAGTESGVLSTGQVQMRGDVEIGQVFQKILVQMDIDLEELLSRYTGDTPARKLGNLVRDFGGWATETLDLARTNSGEYLQEEKKILVTGLAMERLQGSVDKLRADTDRLEQRIARIRDSLKRKK